MPDSQVGAERLLTQLGGISGLVYSSLPVVAFVPISGMFGLRPAIVTALGVAALVLAWRVIRRESTQPAVSGFFGVLICVAIAYLAGESRGYFALGIWMSLLWATVFAVSVLVRRPAVGYAWSWLGGRDRSWRRTPRAVYAFDAATVTWALVFASRFAVQRVLYNAGETGWLGVARITMGWPLTVVAAAVTYLAIKYVQRVLATSETISEQA